MNENPTDAKEQFELGRKYRNGEGVPKDMEKAMYWFTKAAEQGNTEAQIVIGRFYAYGAFGSGPIDLEKAEYWYTKAAEQGDVSGLSALAEEYDGNGDSKKAVYLYTKAAELGWAEAQYNLGVCYFKGEGVTKDVKKAKYWITKAAENGDANAKEGLRKLNADSSSNNNFIFYFPIIGALSLGSVLAVKYGFAGFFFGAIIGWFIGKFLGWLIGKFIGKKE